MREIDPIGTMAMFIAAALQHPNPPCNGREVRISTIKIEQHKNKFSQVVVYLNLAEQNLVAQRWAELGNVDQPPQTFIDSCVKHDARLYRRTYMAMISLVPNKKSEIIARADHTMLLFDDKADLDAWLVSRNSPDSKTNAEWKLMTKLWNSSTIEELQQKLHDIYDDKGW